MKFISEEKVDLIKEQIAIVLFKIGIKPKVTIFIDEHTLSYGYGKMDGIGLWEYQIPFKYTNKKNEDS